MAPCSITPILLDSPGLFILSCVTGLHGAPWGHSLNNLLADQPEPPG